MFHVPDFIDGQLLYKQVVPNYVNGISLAKTYVDFVSFK